MFEQDSDLFICYRCIGEPFLKAEVKREGNRVTCSYCERKAKGYLIAKLAYRVDTAFREHYERIYEMFDDEGSWQDGFPVIEAIQYAANIPAKAALDIQEILEEDHNDFHEALVIGEESEYGSGTYYDTKDYNDDYWRSEWESYEHSLKTESRFFSQSGIQLLKSIFENIGDLVTKDKLQAIKVVGPGTSLTELYRARTFQSEKKMLQALMEPDKELGTPPTAFALAGRMNAQGIAVFYGSNEPQAALAEVRPAVGSKVAIAKFQIIRSLQLLDLSKLGKLVVTGSIFDSKFAKLKSKVQFLSSLSERMTLPVMPDDQAQEYLITQAIADYLATEPNGTYDGIMFPSSQVEGESLNVVLFHKAALVEAVKYPDGATINVSGEERYGELLVREYHIYENYPKLAEVQSKDVSINDPDFDFNAFLDKSAIREPTLRIDMDSITVHVVKSVKISTEEFPVTRDRYYEQEYFNLKNE